MEMEVVDLSTPEPDTTADLRGRLERAVERLEEKRQDPQWRTRTYERERIGAKIEGVKLALSYLPDGERIAVASDRPGLAITPGIVQAFDTAYRTMLYEESKPLGQRDPRPATRVYAQAAILGDMLRATGIPGVSEDEPGVVLSAMRDLLGMRDGQSFADAEEAEL